MSEYVKATNFATKDTLPSGDSNKIVKGTEIDNELNAISGAVSSKADIASPTFTGTPAGPTATAGASTTQLATTAFVTAALSAVYPVGSIYINAAVSTNPNTLLGFGTWTAFGAGKVIVGLDSADALFDTLEETGGSKDAIAVTHTHTATTTATDSGHTHTTAFNQTSKSGNATPNMLSNPSTGENLNGSTSLTTGSSTATITATTTVASAGSSGTNANVQPFIVVKMWKRTA
jgi:hypothetical protein